MYLNDKVCRGISTSKNSQQLGATGVSIQISDLPQKTPTLNRYPNNKKKPKNDTPVHRPNIHPHSSSPSPVRKAYGKSNGPFASFNRITLPASDLAEYAPTDLSVLIRLNEVKLG